MCGLGGCPNRYALRAFSFAEYELVSIIAFGRLFHGIVCIRKQCRQICDANAPKKARERARARKIVARWRRAGETQAASIHMEKSTMKEQK